MLEVMGFATAMSLPRCSGTRLGTTRRERPGAVTSGSVSGAPRGRNPLVERVSATVRVFRGR
jgi:hypothetical protein